MDALKKGLTQHGKVMFLPWSEFKKKGWRAVVGWDNGAKRMKAIEGEGEAEWAIGGSSTSAAASNECKYV